MTGNIFLEHVQILNAIHSFIFTLNLNLKTLYFTYKIAKFFQAYGFFVTYLTTKFLKVTLTNYSIVWVTKILRAGRGTGTRNRWRTGMRVQKSIKKCGFEEEKKTALCGRERSKDRGNKKGGENSFTSFSSLIRRYRCCLSRSILLAEFLPMSSKHCFYMNPNTRVYNL